MSVAEALRIDPEIDVRMMDLAIRMGRRMLGRTWPNPAVGAVVVQDGPNGPIVVGRGATQPGGRPHAETEALRQAGTAARGGTLYVTLEPCSHHGKTPPCADAILGAGIRRVVSAMDDANPSVTGAGHRRLRAAGVQVDVGLGGDEVRRNLVGHMRRMQDGRPHVMLKLALSSDDKVGLPGRKPAAITGEETRARVHMMRAMSDAIAVGVGTAMADNPSLTCRLPGMLARSPVRVVFDTNLRLPVDNRLVQTVDDAPLWVITGVDAPVEAERALQSRGIEVIRVRTEDGRVRLEGSLNALAARGITSLMVEGGPILARALLNEDLVDEATIMRGPITIGDEGVPALDGLPIEAITGSERFREIVSMTCGDDSYADYVRA
ncbi:riboflavin biosynthesis protein RibD [Variibacter gotjawalensis]|uniref:Riboflavin biosynthesis protein RibD n=1 Tax=Variibacter gotjawalensis TaxID=1333996 RepID=A0A0S3PXC1_9BRAD|nr:bifunctional diaminohydroxyphosphoribosylaminopyrimidine deaminase/5-amino-6-(5-phosphoribosylamino)uracil reductase RibD [Variibacter gotjawalensis]NIK46403.1 diaminohydroxyphosphoribosylaminopyrimidine deaminase/5-amino-6-(5-phosphoribosylamino)uracil reductase [Variibacter gotjawalensis]RZS48313.1 diaminohydroxyphosphoribosylaminopyrimidine deaminase/5-amino-6-(5-phosphoribosylamino)uracil reductase [Variibacter gotjawalensis]BAT60573.1 riboflavin biosynthesis protein RibD [Variibacter got